MISLNRPYEIKGKDERKVHAWESRNIVMTYSSREGLSRIYKQLYLERGSLHVAVSPLTCFIAIYPIVANGHIPVFIDIDPKTLNMSEEALMVHEEIQAMQTIYLGGNPMRMDMVVAWAKKHEVVVIEDCAQALGAMYNGRMCGTFGEYAVASAVKNLYSVAGGLLVGDKRSESGGLKVKSWLMVYKRLKRWLEKKADKRKWSIWNLLYGRLLKLRDTRDDSFTNIVHSVPENVEREIWDALGQIDEIQALRTRNAERLMRQIDGTRYAVQQVPENGESTRNRVIVVAKHREAREVIATLRTKGIAANNLTQSYTHPYQEHIQKDAMLGKYYTERLDVYEQIFPKVVSVPCSPALSDMEIDYIAKELNAI